MCLRDFFELQRKVVGCVCAILCGGPILIIIGIVILAGAGTKTRENGISAYNGAVSSWSSYGYATWSTYPGAQMVLNNANVVNNFVGGGAPNNPAVEVDNGISTYVNTYAFQPTSTALQQATISNYFPTTWSTSPAMLTLKASAAATATTMYSGSVPAGFQNVINNYCSGSVSDRCYGSQYNSCNNRCASLYGGAYNCNANTCQTWYTLNQICIVIDPLTNTADRSWNNNPGCVPLDTSSSKVTSSSYASIGATNGVGVGGYTASASPPGVVNWPATLSVVVRSSQDPYVTAVRVTSGNPASFGLSVGAKIGLGIGLIAAGLIWTTAVLGVIYCLVRSHRRRRAVGGTVLSGPQPQYGVAQAAVPVASVVSYPTPGSPYAMQQPMMQQQQPGYPQAYSPQAYPPQPQVPQMGYPPAQSPYAPQPGAYPQPQGSAYPPGLGLMQTQIVGNGGMQQQQQPPSAYPYPKTV